MGSEIIGPKGTEIIGETHWIHRLAPRSSVVVHSAINSAIGAPSWLSECRPLAPFPGPDIIGLNHYVRHRVDSW